MVIDVRVQGLLRKTVGLALLLLSSSLGARVYSQSSEEQPLTAADVLAVIQTAATAIGDDTMAIAVVDRGGRILGVFARSGADSFTPDVAVTTARTAAMFSNAQAPLSSRTVRFISGIHFPPGVPNAPSAALYGIENTNRGCQLNAADTAPFPRPRSIVGSALDGLTTAGCRPTDSSGCAIGTPITMADGTLNYRVGFSTGKSDVRDRAEPLNAPVNPGGFAVYRNGQVVGAVGVSGVDQDQAEFV